MRWILGDIHGMLRPLEAIVATLRARDPHAQLIFVGDYVNRGPDSRGVVDFLLALENARFCRGNHDDVFDLILNGHWLGGDDARLTSHRAVDWFFPHGLAATLASYGVSRPQITECRRGVPDDECLAEIRDAVPAAHRAFFRDLPLVIDDDGLFVAHAFWPPDVANGTSSIEFHLAANPRLAHQVVWQRWRPDELRVDKPTWTRPAFFGHTPTMNYPRSLRALDVGPVAGPMVTLLDTAVALGEGGRLTAICAEDLSIVQVDREGAEICG